MYTTIDRAERPKYSNHDLIMLSGKNIRTHRPYNKLEDKLHIAFENRQVISEPAIRLYLAVKWKIDIVFHVSLVQPCI
jgi:hypothetical protein